MRHRTLRNFVVAIPVIIALTLGAACGSASEQWERQESALAFPWGIIWGVAEAIGLAYIVHEYLTEEDLVLLTRGSYYWRINELEECGDEIRKTYVQAHRWRANGRHELRSRSGMHRRGRTSLQGRMEEASFGEDAAGAGTMNVYVRATLFVVGPLLGVLACGESDGEDVATAQLPVMSSAYTYASAALMVNGSPFIDLETDTAATPDGGLNIFERTEFDACEEWFSNYAGLRADRAFRLEPVVLQDLVDAVETKVHWIALCGAPPVGSVRAGIWPAASATAGRQALPCGMTEDDLSGENELMCTAEQIASFNAYSCKPEAEQTRPGQHKFKCKGRCFPDWDSDFWGPAEYCYQTGTTTSNCNCFFNAAGNNGEPMTDLPPEVCENDPVCDASTFCSQHEVVIISHRVGNRVLERARLVEIRVSCANLPLKLPTCDCLTRAEIRAHRGW